MPVIFSNPNFPNQSGVNTTNQPYVTQLNFGQMLREVCGLNPNYDPMTAGRAINNIYRRILDMRSWYGLKVRGQIQVPAPYSTGTCTVTNNSSTVIGIGTAWTLDLIGQQFRINFTYPYQTIMDVDVPNQALTLDMPFAGPPTTSGYQITAVYFEMEANIRRFLWGQNQQMGWTMRVNMPVETINEWDPWRTSFGWSKCIATRPPTVSGQMQVELWPNPFQQQVIPFEAYTQPADMQDDTDSPVPFVRSDVLVLGASVEALLYRPKQNTFYDAPTAIQIATMKQQQYNEGMADMIGTDNDVDQRDVSWDYGDEGGAGIDSTYAQNHDV